MPITPIAAEAKYDGIRLVLERDGSRVWIFTEDKKRDRAKFLPGVVKEMKKLPCTSVILDSETVIWAGGAPIPRHEMIKIVVSKTPLIEEEIHCNIFDCLYYNGKNLTDLPWKERQKYLKRVLPKDLKYLKRVVPCIITNRRTFDNCIEKASKYPGCFLPSSRILTNFNYPLAEQVSTDLHTFNRNGIRQNIQQTEQLNFDGFGIAIKPVLLLEVQFTPNHPLLAFRPKIGPDGRNLRPGNYYFKHFPSGAVRDFKLIPRWIHAENVKIGDFVKIPKLLRKNGNIKTGLTIPSQFSNPNFLKFLGWYVAEGWCSEKKGEIYLELNQVDLPIVHQLVHSFHSGAIRTRQRSELSDEVIELIFYSKELSCWLKKNFGHLAPNKRLPEMFLNFSLVELRSFLWEYFRGDGCFHQEKRETHSTKFCLRFTSASEVLLRQIQLLLFNFGIASALDKIKREGKINKFPHGRSYAVRDLFNLEIAGNQRQKLFPNLKIVELHNQKKQYFWTDDGIWLRVSKVSKFPYTGPIYNVVTDDHSVLAPFITHNSEGAMVKSTESKYVTGRSGDWAKFKKMFELKMSTIGLTIKPLPLRPAPKSDLTGPEALRTFKRLQKDSKTYILRCAYRGKTGRLEPIVSDHKLTPGDLSLKWDAAKKKWKGTEDPRIWQMAKGMPHRKHGEYAYGNTYGKKLEPGPRMGSIVTVRPIMVRKFTIDGKPAYSWMFPNLREIDPERSTPDDFSDMERIARESAARTPGKKMEIMSAIHEMEE